QQEIYSYPTRRSSDLEEEEDDEDEEDEESEEDDGDISGKYEMDEVFDSSLTAENWSDSEGNRLVIGSLCVEEEELLDPKKLRAVDRKSTRLNSSHEWI